MAKIGSANETSPQDEDDSSGQFDRKRVDRLWEESIKALRESASQPDAVGAKAKTRFEAVAKEYGVQVLTSVKNFEARFLNTKSVRGAPPQRLIGDALKWLAVVRVVMHHRTTTESGDPKGDAQSCIGRCQPYSPSWASLSVLNRLLFVNSREGVKNFSTVSHPAWKVLVAWLNDLAVRQGRPRLQEQDILDRQVPWGADPVGALQSFHDWLLTDVWAPAPAPSKSEARASSARLKSKAKTAATALLAPSAKKAPVVNAVCGEARGAVEPFVDAVVEKIRELDKARGKPQWGVGTTVIRISVDADAADPGSVPRMLTPTDALEKIAAAFGISIQAKDMRESDRLYRQAMSEVRRACTLQRCVIVFSTLEYFEGRHSRLLNLMKGRGWGAFIRVLCQVHWQTAVRFGLKEPTGARVLVVSDAPMVTLGRWAEELIDLRRAAAGAEKPPGGTAEWIALYEPLVSSKTEGAVSPASLTELIMLAFIACSPDGVSYGTLLRGMRHWLDLTSRVRVSDAENAPLISPTQAWRDQLAQVLTGTTIVEAVQQLISKHGTSIARSIDEPLPWVSEGRVRFEWQARADVLDLPRETGSVKAHLFEAKIHFRSEAQRREFIRTVLTGDNQPARGRAIGVALGDHLWRLVNFSIAIESLRQATSQLRSLGGQDAHNLEATRRLVQTIYHLRAAGDIDIQDQDETYAAYLSIPKSPTKRYRYVYCFLLRRCVEADKEYRLSRAHARSEIRTPLISLFLVDDVRSLESGKGDDHKEFVAALEAGYARWHESSKLRGEELLPDILVNLATSAVDADDFAVAEWALGKIKQGGEGLQSTRAALAWSGREVDERRVIESWTSGYGASYAKLQFDFLDKAGRTEPAFDHCKASLLELGASADLSTKIEEAVKAYVNTFKRGKVPEPFRRLEELLGAVIDDQLARLHNDRTQMAISDMLFRLADVLATKADAKDRTKTPYIKRLDGLLNAFGTFFLADRVRSSVAGKSGYGIAWSRLSAKGNRIYVRTSLAIARTLTELDELVEGEQARKPLAPATAAERRKRLYDVATEFMQHAAHRSDVYVRHLHGHRREVLHGLLLKSSEVRTWAAIANSKLAVEVRQQAGGAGSVDAALNAPPTLEEARRYLEDAESILHDMGSPDEPSRRVWLERVSVFIGSSREPHGKGTGGDAKAFGALVKADLETAKRLMLGSKFWGPLIERQEKRWEKLRPA